MSGCFSFVFNAFQTIDLTISKVRISSQCGLLHFFCSNRRGSSIRYTLEGVTPARLSRSLGLMLRSAMACFTLIVLPLEKSSEKLCICVIQEIRRRVKKAKIWNSKLCFHIRKVCFHLSRQKENPSKPYTSTGLPGEPGGIRTHDLLIRSQTLYPAELRAHMLHLVSSNQLDYYSKVPEKMQALF